MLVYDFELVELVRMEFDLDICLGALLFEVATFSEWLDHIEELYNFGLSAWNVSFVCFKSIDAGLISFEFKFDNLFIFLCSLKFIIIKFALFIY